MDKVKAILMNGEELLAYGGRLGLGKYYCFYEQNHYESKLLEIAMKDVKEIQIIEADSLDVSNLPVRYHPSVPPERRI